MDRKGRVHATDQLTIPEKVRAAVKLLKPTVARGKLSISAVCRAAGVSRASLYEHHRDLVNEILERPRGKSRDALQAQSSAAARVRELSKALKESEAKYQAVVAVCIELTAELRALRLQFESVNSSRAGDRRPRFLQR